MANWGIILDSKQNREAISKFVNGEISTNETFRKLRGTEGFTEFYRVVKERRSDPTRELARRALRRRNVSV